MSALKLHFWFQKKRGNCSRLISRHNVACDSIKDAFKPLGQSRKFQLGIERHVYAGYSEQNPVASEAGKANDWRKRNGTSTRFGKKDF
jgi:hypothetical protein